MLMIIEPLLLTNKILSLDSNKTINMTRYDDAFNAYAVVLDDQPGLFNNEENLMHSEETWDDLYFQQGIKLKKINIPEDEKAIKNCSLIIYPQERKLFKTCQPETV